MTGPPTPQSVTLRAAALLREVMASHRDVASADYNECEKSMCAWCEEADAILERLERA